LKGQQLTYPKLNLKSEEATAYRAICGVLKNDSVFGPATNTFIEWDGTSNDTTDPEYSWTPYCRVDPFPQESEWVTESQHMMPMMLRIQLCTAGTQIENSMGYWAAMRAALFPQNPTQRDNVKSLLVNAGISRLAIQMSAYGTRSFADSSVLAAIAEGMVRCAILIGT
jgi:hypothetical protein